MNLRNASLLVVPAVLLALSACTTHQPVVAPPAPPPAPAAAPAPAPAPAGGSAAAAAPDPDAAKMPAGDAKAMVVNLCTECHTLARVVAQHKTRAQWEDTLQSMQDNGLTATQQQLTAVLDYLSKNYPSLHPGP
jgi:hypothetical protein